MSKNKYFIPFDLLYEIATPSTTVRNDNIPYAVKTRRYEQFKAFTSILVNLELSDKNKARYKQDKASADFSTGDLHKVNEREKTQA